MLSEVHRTPESPVEGWGGRKKEGVGEGREEKEGRRKRGGATDSLDLSEVTNPLTDVKSA